MTDVTVLNVSDLAHYFRVHKMTVYRLIKSGELPAFKVGGKYWRVKLEVVDRWRLRLQRDAPGQTSQRTGS
jgi:excisionase family DNA binding protein